MLLNEQAGEKWIEMCDHYYARTNKHIQLVRKYCRRIEKAFNIFPGIIQRGQEHDDSKFKQPELIPYILLTWKYKCKDEGVKFKIPERAENLMHEATLHHVTTNDHHPEFYCAEYGDLINKTDRDKPRRLIDARSMGILPIAEMVADWCAVAEERGNTAKDWADSNIGVRWDFDKDQQQLIYGLITEIWEV